MAEFVYQAKSLDGRIVKGQLTAASDQEARVRLRAARLIPLKVLPKMDKAEAIARLRKRKGRVSGKDLQVFTRQFATLVNSGIPVMQSLEILSNATASAVLRTAVSKVKEDIENGQKLADAMALHNNVFDHLYINLLRAGEESGSLDSILERIAEYIEKSMKIKNKVLGALYYPAGIMIVSFIVISVILTYVIPKFAELFESSGQELPWLTQQVIAASDFMRDYWYIVFGVVGGAVYGFIQYYRSDGGRKKIDAIVIRTPLFGDLIQKSAIARFSRTLSTMITCGVSILEGLEISAKVVGNAVLEKTFLDSRDVIAEGKSITLPLAEDPYIPDMVVQMIGVGEQTGALDVMLGKIADFYEEEVDYAVGAITSMMEPIMMVFLGGIIAVLVVAMYLPIFNMAGAAGA